MLKKTLFLLLLVLPFLSQAADQMKQKKNAHHKQFVESWTVLLNENSSKADTQKWYSLCCNIKIHMHEKEGYSWADISQIEAPAIKEATEKLKSRGITARF